MLGWCHKSEYPMMMVSACVSLTMIGGLKFIELTICVLAILSENNRMNEMSAKGRESDDN
jgi:hypothetical protein